MPVLCGLELVAGKVEIVPLGEVTLLRADGNYISVVTHACTWLAA